MVEKRALSTIFLIMLSSLTLFSLDYPIWAHAAVDTNGEEIEVLAIGTGTIVNGNVAKGKKIAVSQALIKGVEEYLTRYLGSTGMVNNFPRIVQDIMPKAKELVENFNILAEDRKDNRIQVLVKVKVNETVMGKSLREMGILIMEGPPIKILFLVSQLFPLEGDVSYWWRDPERGESLTQAELILYRLFQERGFQPINRLTSLPERDFSSEMKSLELSDEEAVEWGELYSADVVMYGRCEIFRNENVRVTLKALDVGQGVAIVDEGRVEAIGPENEGDDPIIAGIEKTMTRLSDRFSKRIIKGLDRHESKVSRLDVTLAGLKSYGQFNGFREFLKNDIKGVTTVRTTKVKGNTISLVVDYLGDENRFLERLVKHENFPFLADLRKGEAGGILIQIR
jgi:hypothetical protein